MVRAPQGCISVLSRDLLCSQHRVSSAGKTGWRGRLRASAVDAEMLPVVCVQKYRNIWAASCSRLFQKAKQNECEINSYQQQDENIYRKMKHRMGEKGAHIREQGLRGSRAASQWGLPCCLCSHTPSIQGK